MKRIEMETECYAAAAILQSGESESGILEAAESSHTPVTKVTMTEMTRAETLKKYPVLFLPHPQTVTEKTLTMLIEYVKQGGCLIVGAAAGLTNADERSAAAKNLSTLTGAEAAGGAYVGTGESVYLDFDGQQIDAGTYCEALKIVSEDARVLEIYGGNTAGNPYAGKPALTERRLGEGRVLRFGGTFTEELADSLLAYTGVRNPFGEVIWLPKACRLEVRENRESRWLYVTNRSDEERCILLKRECVDAETEKTAEGGITLAAGETKVFKIKAQ